MIITQPNHLLFHAKNETESNLHNQNHSDDDPSGIKVRILRVALTDSIVSALQLP